LPGALLRARMEKMSLVCHGLMVSVVPTMAPIVNDDHDDDNDVIPKSRSHLVMHCLSTACTLLTGRRLGMGG
jgi:hypothetical protein